MAQSPSLRRTRHKPEPHHGSEDRCSCEQNQLRTDTTKKLVAGLGPTRTEAFATLRKGPNLIYARRHHLQVLWIRVPGKCAIHNRCYPSYLISDLIISLAHLCRLDREGPVSLRIGCQKRRSLKYQLYAKAIQTGKLFLLAGNVHIDSLG